MTTEVILQLSILGALGIGGWIFVHYHGKKIEKEFNGMLEEKEMEEDDRTD